MREIDKVELAFIQRQWELTERLKAENGFLAIRVLNDGSIAAVDKLTTTVSLMLGVTEYSWQYRFCYESATDALIAFSNVYSEEDVPEGWIACRPEMRIKEPPFRYMTPDELRDWRDHHGGK